MMDFQSPPALQHKKKYVIGMINTKHKQNDNKTKTQEIQMQISTCTNRYCWN